jgi:plastocyanin
MRMRRRGTLGGRRGIRAAAAAVAASAAVGGVGIASAEDGGTQDARATVLADVTIEARDDFWATPEVTIQPGDTVTWTFAGTSRPHNVASDNEVAADPAWTGFAEPGEFEIAPVDAAYPYTFDEPGDYVFICQFHSASMRGTVHVEGDGGEPTPTPTPTPTPDPEPTPEPEPPNPSPPSTSLPSPPAPHVTATPPGTSALADTVRPQLSRVAARGMRDRRIRVRFSLDEPASVAVRVAQRGRQRALRTVGFQGHEGRNTVFVRSRAFKRGRRYTVELRARDAAGNRSAPDRAGLRLPQRR